MVEISQKIKHEMEEKFTKYEIARILGARALQLAMNAPILLKISREELEKVNYDPLRIAELEFYAGVLPITVKRPLPPKKEEKIIAKERPKKEEVKKEKEVKGKERYKEERKLEEEKIEEEIVKEIEGSEIMELATPEDEIEEKSTEELEEEF